MMKTNRTLASKATRRVARLLSVAAVFCLNMPRAVAEDECEALLEDEAMKGLHSQCILVLDLETFSRAWLKKEGWKEAGDYSTTAIHTIDYLLKKLGTASSQATLVQQMTRRRAELEQTAQDCATRLARTKEEEEKKNHVFVNLRIPTPAPSVYVNGSQVAGPVHVPEGPIVLGLGQPGVGYDEGQLATVGKRVDVQVVLKEQSPEPDPAARGIRASAWDFSVGPILGGRQLFWEPHTSQKVAGLGGARGEAVLPDLLTRETIRLRPMLRYTFEYSPTGGGWIIHSGGVGLKLTVAGFVDFGLSGGASYISDPRFGHRRFDGDDLTGLQAHGLFGELSVGAHHTIFGAGSIGGPKLGIGASLSAGMSGWLAPPAKKDYGVLVAPYVHGSIFLQLRFGRSRPPRVPLDAAMVRFKGGPVQIGSDQGERSEGPAHVVLLGSFELDVKEVTVADYHVCVDAGKCEMPDTAAGCNWNVSGRRNHPINCVSRKQANDYCAFVGKRLPTEAEWEHAARGGDQRKYPWGSKPPTFEPCWMGSDKSARATCEVGSHPQDVTPEGLFDLAGNVSEWTGQYCDYMRATCGGEGWVSRGGSFGHEDPEALRSSARYVPKEAALETVGFRCAR